MASLSYKREARKALQRMDGKTRERVFEALERLAEDPDRRDLDVRPVIGNLGFRLRVGDWRILFTREEDEIVVRAIRPRGQAYRG